MPATFQGAPAKRRIHAIISIRGGARSRTQPERSLAGERHRKNQSETGLGELIKWLKSSSKRVESLYCLRFKTPQGHSRDSLSWMMTSATLLIHPQSGSDWFSCGASRRPSYARLCPAAGTAPDTDYRMYSPLRGCTLKGRWHLLINLGYASQGILCIFRSTIVY